MKKYTELLQTCYQSNGNFQEEFQNYICFKVLIELMQKVNLLNDVNCPLSEKAVQTSNIDIFSRKHPLLTIFCAKDAPDPRLSNAHRIMFI